jgi:DNA polymerase III subunit gamma/tau
MPEQPLDPQLAAPLREGAAMARAVAARLAALTTGVDERFVAALSRLQGLPGTASLDPFALLAGALPGAPPAGSSADETLRRSPATTRPGALPAAAARAGATAPAPAAGQGRASPARGHLEGIADALELPRRLLARIAEQVVLTSQPAPRSGSPAEPLPGPAAGSAARRTAAPPAVARRRPPQPAHTKAPGDLVRDLARRIGAGQRAAAPQVSPSHAQDMPSPMLGPNLEQLLRRIAAGKARATPGGTTHGREPAGERARTPARAAPPATTTVTPEAIPARRAPSLLLGSEGVVAGAATGSVSPGAAAAPPGTTGVPSAVAPAQPADTDDVIAEINRLLVDQAWLRGVDLK